MTDEEIEDAVQKAGGRWNGSVWKFEDADLHPFVRALLAAERARCLSLLFNSGAPRSDTYGDWAPTAEAIETGLRA